MDNSQGDYVVIVGYIKGDVPKTPKELHGMELEVLTLAGEHIRLPKATVKDFIPLATTPSESSVGNALSGPYRFFIDRASSIYVQIPITTLEKSGSKPVPKTTPTDGDGT